MLELAHPWLLALLLLPLLVRWLLPAYHERIESVRTPFFAELADRAGVRPAPGAVKAQRSLGEWILLILCWLLVVFAAARPQWVDDPMTEIRSARDLMLAVDLSGSMETTDFTDAAGNRVDRLTAVKLVLEDFVAKRETDRLGLVLFGNAAFLQVPFTLDHDVFLQLLGEAQIGMAGPRTMIGDAIGLAIKAFESSEAESRLLIVLTDGNDTGSKVPPPKAAAIAAQNDITIHTIGIGDPETVGEAPLDEATLREIAEVTGGQFFRAEDNEALDEVYSSIDALEPLEFDTLSFRPTHELYPWAIGALVVLVLLYHGSLAVWSVTRRYRSSRTRSAHFATGMPPNVGAP